MTILEGATPLAADIVKDGSDQDFMADVLKGIGFIPRGPETQIYSIDNLDLNLVATAEITLPRALGKDQRQAWEQIRKFESRN